LRDNEPIFIHNRNQLLNMKENENKIISDKWFYINIFLFFSLYILIWYCIYY
jgi:hypothetical protein